MKSWLGIEPNDAKGRHFSDIIGKPAFAKIEGKIRDAARGNRQKFETHLPYAYGGPRHVSAEYVPHIDGGEVRGIFALMTDISEQKAAADALSKSEAQFRTLFAHLPVGAALVDRQGQILLENCSIAFCRLGRRRRRRRRPPACSIGRAPRTPPTALSFGRPVTRSDRPCAGASHAILSSCAVTAMAESCGFA